jgi:hypothetical protein
MGGLVDLIIVGSGPSGAQAAQAAIERGLSVVMVDVGNDDDTLAPFVPDRPFSEIRRTDVAQHRYFVGERLPAGAAAGQRVGSQLAPPRQFITRDVETCLPFESTNFFPLQTLALGGLGAGWGAGTHTFEDFELRAAGLSWDLLARHYQQVADDIGISGAVEEDTAPLVLNIPNVQAPLERDTNAKAILETYRRRRERFHRVGFFLGKAPAAILSERLARGTDVREPNPYHDMDFYSDHRRSVYRPKYTIEALVRHPRFEYVGRTLAVKFEETASGTVRLVGEDVRNHSARAVEGRTLALAAGAINSARIVLSSLGQYDVKVPLLSNPYNYIPCVNLKMLGRPADDRRHSLGQLTGVLTAPAGVADRLILSFYSYRSLLLFRLVKEMPLPPALGVQVARVLQTSLTIIGLHHVDRPAPQKWLALRKGADGREVLAGHYALSADEQRDYRRNLRRVVRTLLALRCVPLSILQTGAGSSIHYAGTLPCSDDPRQPLQTAVSGKLNGTRHVYLADSAPWKFLPAKGPTFTLMANARRVVEEIDQELRTGTSPA